MTTTRLAAVFAALGFVVVALHAQDTSPFKFKSGVELVNVTATVSDANGRFVPNLTQDDFVVYEDDQRVDVTHFSAERVPVSLGIALDTSGSMAGEKMNAARAAIGRFVNELLDRNDELFLYRFSNYPVLVQGWTRDRRDLLDPLGRLTPNGATAMYDAVAKAVPLAQQGQNQKKALVVISDGNDTSSRTEIRDLKALIRQSEVLVYAVGTTARANRSPDARPSRLRRACRFRSRCPSLARHGEEAAVADVSRRRRPSRRSESDPATAEPEAAWAGLWTRRPRQRVGAARHDRRQRRAHRSHPQPPRSRPCDGRHCRRVEQAVLPGLPVAREEGRTLARHPRRNEDPRGIGVRARRGYFAS